MWQVKMKSKCCQLCGEDKPLDDYHKNKQIKDGKHTICKQCNKKKTKSWREENPEKYRDQNFKRKYGLTHEDVEKMKVGCGYKCEICGVPEVLCPRGVLFVDHCHSSGKVRGMLCHNCNSLLGYSKDYTYILESALRYLKIRGAE